MRRRWYFAVLASVAIHTALTATLFTAGKRLPGGLPVRSNLVNERADVVTMSLDEPARPVQIVSPPTPAKLSEEVVATAVPLPTKTAPSPGPIRAVGHQETAHNQNQNQRANAPRSPALHTRVPAGRSVVYLLDRSGSMRHGRRLNIAAEIIAESLKNIDPAATFQVVYYGSRAEQLGPREELLPATPGNLGHAAEVLAGLIPEGASGHRDGVKLATRFRADVVMWLTDDDDIDLKLAREVLEWRGETRIYPTLLGPPSGPRSDSFLRMLAERTGGQLGVRPLPHSPPDSTIAP